MRITQLDLENVKSYRRESLVFTGGTNAICGPNGAGKSTLLEAVGFALFDFLLTKQGQFVREGETTATVTVHLADKDGRTYQVVRKCGGSNQYYVYDPEIEQRLTDGKGETTAWLYEFLGVEESGELTALFRDAVGVPQGLLTAAFLDRPGNRKNTFDPLLRVDEYEKAWAALRDPGRRLELAIQDQKEDIAGFEAEVKALPGWQEKATDLQVAIEADEKRGVDLQDELESVARRKEALEEIKERLDELGQTAARAEANVKTLDVQLVDAQAAVVRARQAHSIVEETESGHQAYLAAQANLEALEEQRQERDRLNATVQVHTTDLALAEQRADGLVSELETIAAAEVERETLRPRVEAQEQVEGELAEARRAADRLDNARQNLVKERQRVVNLENKRSSVQARLAERIEVEKEIEALQTDLATLSQERDGLRTQIAAQQAELDQLGEQATRVAGRVTRSEQSLDQERARLADMEARLSEVQTGLRELTLVEERVETFKAELEDLATQQESLSAQVSAQQAELDHITAQIAVLEAAETAECPVCEGPLTPEHRAELLARHRARLVELETALTETQSQREKVKESRNQKQEALESLEKSARTLPRPEEAAALLAQMDAQRQVVAKNEAALKAERAEVSANQTRREDLKAALADFKPRQDEIEDAWREKQTELGQLEKRSKALPRPAEAEELAAQIEAQKKSLGEIEATVVELSDAPAEAERLVVDLAALGDPRRDYQRAADVASKREAVERDLAETGERVRALKGEIDGLNEALSGYAGLDERIGAERAALETHASDYRRYLEHVREAESLNERQERVSTLGKKVEAARTEHERLVEARDQVAAQYDADSYARLAESYAVLRDEATTLNERLRHQKGQLEEAQAEIGRLEDVQAELEKAHAEHVELNDLLTLLRHIRKVLRDAGPKVTQAMVEVISLQAARLYAEIMGDHSTRLRWTEDYEVLLTTGGRERGFQQLSGGEQMAAALAVRLALLREVSEVNLAFFDEPTANLDDERRDSLAEQILNVKGFSQLFVISHDDTFERDTDNVVRVVKENGLSRVADTPLNGMEA